MIHDREEQTQQLRSPAQAAPSPTPHRALLALQQSAGNQAVAKLLRLETTPTARDGVAAAAETIATYFINAPTSARREQLLQTLLQNRDRAAELRAAYEGTWKRDLDRDLASMGGADALRALDSLNYGELRPMSKVLIALGGAGTDTTTLFRVLKECNRAAPAGQGFARFETMWSAVTGSLPDTVFPDFKSQTLSAALDEDLDGYELVKAHATLAYGDLRPIDKVYIATIQSGTDEAMLFEGLARCNPNTIEADFQAYEFRNLAFSDNASSIWDALDAELSGEDYRRALALLGREPNPEYGWVFGSSEKTRKLGDNQRLVALVKAAVHGAGTNVELIMSAIDEATQAERDVLRAEVEARSDPLGLAGWFGDLSSGELSRLKAKLGIQESAADAAGQVTDGQLADPAVQLLRSLGGVDRSTIFDQLKLSAGATWARFKAEWEKGRGPFNEYVSANTTAIEKGYLSGTIFSTDLDLRLNFCFGVLSDDEDYFFHLLGNFASNADKRRLAGDAKFMGDMRSALSSSELGRAITLLKPSDLTPQENAKWLTQAVERERSGFFDLFSSTGDAVADENRELQAGTTLAGLDGNLTPEERRLLEQRGARTQGALDDYTAARDEFANTASMVANTAVSVIIAAITGGAAGPIVLAQLARAAAAMAVAKVLTEKVIRGDRFDIIGADGAVAFATGAVEGVMNVSGGLAAKGVIGAQLDAVGLSAKAASGSLFRGAARNGLLAVTEGTLAGGSTSMVDTMARDETWRQGIAEGLERVASSTAGGAATGAGMALSLHAALGGIKALRGAPEEALPLSHADNPLVGKVLAGDEGAMKRLVTRMERWEKGIGELKNGTGLGEGLEKAMRDELVAKLVAHRQGIVETLGKQFNAHAVGDASAEAGSDVDLNVKGDDAGAKLIAAEQYMESAYPGWQKKYRMGLLIDASRIGSAEELIAALPADAKARVRARVTQETATLMYARRLSFLQGAERAAMEADPPPGVDVGRAKQLAALGGDARIQMRNEALLKGDQLLAELKTTTDPAVKAQLAEKVTFQQMLANAMDDEAYISAGGVKGFALGQKLTNAAEQYQALLDQVGMIAHTVKEAGGVIEAARRYELFKYVFRICQLFEQAGIQDERLAFFKNWSELVYRVDREATGALDRPGPIELAGSAKKASVMTDAGAPQTAPSDRFLLDNYGRFGEMVEHHGLDLAKQADAGGGASGSPQLLRLPRPTPADGVGGAASPAVPTAIAGDSAALMQRLTQSRRTLEQEIADTEAFPAQKLAAERMLADIKAKPFRQLTPADLMVSAAVQQTLFDAAGGAVDRMKAFAAQMLKGADAEIISIRKREDLAGFVTGILEKCERKHYPILGQMDDIIRGRLNITDGPEVARVAQAMREQSGFRVTDVVEPRIIKDTGVTRYPRWHIIVEDPQTGLTHEWQIGTRATSSLYETKGIKIPGELEAAAKRLGKHFRNDIHDIEYDIFQAFAKREPAAAAELGIPQFVTKVAQASDRSGAGAAHTGLGADIASLHDEAGRILQALVDKVGADDVARLLH
ncbi:hypothetical protein [Solirubrobacter deserti]|uniref:Uncharacterized protein n=1 Tax=Solirubrobacter deserti TaxID=2282478 RepID=A0ABT4RH89_9ACTN|nr:hypothetical protein [Solirubrobacter deserti]MDA0137902.1 hypothetical protein [Solirubrobacter deserti]